MSEFVQARVEIGETAATIAAERRYISPAVEAIKSARREIEKQIRADRYFLITLDPYDREADTRGIVSRMCAASRAAGVGPMATVAGAIAQVALEAMVHEGCDHGWVDNGGDVALLLREPVTMELFCEPGSSTALAFELEPTGTTLGICSSSGRLGHSLSFGDADIAVAIASDAMLADALATAIGNAVTDPGSLDKCFRPFVGLEGFKGGLVMLDGSVSMCGEVPPIVEVEHNPERLTVHSKMASSRYFGSERVRTGVRV